MIERFRCEREFRTRIIAAEVVITEGGVQIGLYGGDRPHIGAVGVLDPEGQITVRQFETHQEGCLCRSWCKALAQRGIQPAVVAAGVHYDAASRDEISQVLTLCAELQNEVLEKLREPMFR